MTNAFGNEYRFPPSASYFSKCDIAETIFAQLICLTMMNFQCERDNKLSQTLPKEKL